MRYISYFLLSALVMALICFSFFGVTSVSMIVYGLLMWLSAVIFDPIFHKIYPSSLTTKGYVDFVYYTLAILGIVFLFQAQEAQRRKDELESREAAELLHRDAATAEISAITKEINDVSELPELIRSAAAEKAKDSNFIRNSYCACAAQLPGTGCEPQWRSTREQPLDETIIILKLAEAKDACERLQTDKSAEVMEQISHEQNLSELQTLIEQRNVALSLSFGRFTITGQEAVSLLNEPDYRQQYIERTTAAAKRQLVEASLALQAIKQEREAENIKINPRAFLSYVMETYWPAFLLAGVGLKLSQSGFSLAKTS